VPGLWLGGVLGRGGGDGKAGGRELADVAADLSLGADALVVGAGAETGKPGGGAGEQAEGDDRDGAGDGGPGFPLAVPFREAAVALAGERAGAGGRAEATEETLARAVPGASPAAASAGPGRGPGPPAAGCSPAAGRAAGRSRGTPRPASFASRTAPFPPALARPGTFFTGRALTS
jgi:hypothetical protein